MANKELAECFNIEETKADLISIKDRISNAELYGEPNEVLKLNIERAERLLDRIEEEAMTESSNLTVRMMEIAAKLIDCITNAANSMITNDLSVDTNNQKQEYLDLKKLEFEFKKEKEDKKAIEGQPSGNVYNTQNILVSSREDLLDWAKNNIEK